MDPETRRARARQVGMLMRVYRTLPALRALVFIIPRRFNPFGGTRSFSLCVMWPLG